MFFIELLLTKKCNQMCDYCSTRLPNVGLAPSVDLEYLRYVLDCLPSNSGVEMSGGEIGLITNLDEAFKIIYNHPNVKHIIALSNGLIRKMKVDWLDKVEYWEHLVWNILDLEISKFYDELDFDPRYKNVIITTYPTTNSLIKYWDHFESIGMFEDHMFYKLMNHKTHFVIDHHLDNLFELYGNLNDTYFLSMLLTKRLKNYLAHERQMCMKYSPNPFVDFTERQLGHCAININKSDRWEFSPKTLERLIYGKCYRQFEYCKQCHSFDYGKNRSPLNNRSYRR